MANPLSRFLNDRFIQPAVDKALSANHPPALGVAHTSDLSLSQAIGQPHDANYSLLYSLYKLNTDVSGCVHKWAGGVTGPGWRITTMDEDAKLTDSLKKEIQEIERWLRNPNPHRLFESMLYTGVTHWGIAGNFYWYVSEDKQKRPLEIWPMHPALTKVIATEQGEIQGYTMQPPTGQPIHFKADSVLDFALPNPTNDLYGESPLELVLEEVGIDLQALRSNKALFQNGMNPSAVMLMDETAKKDDAQAMTDMLKQSHTGSSNQHKIVALSKTKDFKPWTMTNRDLEFLKLRDLATSKVSKAYRLPRVLLGDHNAGDYATTKFLVRDTYENVYQPMQNIISAIITERLIHRFNPELRFELLPPNASDPDDTRKDQMQAKSAGILTADEVRGDSFGKEPLDGELPDETKEDQPSQDDQKPDTDAGDTAEEAPDAKKSVIKAIEPTAYDTIAEQRGQEFDALAAPIVAPIANYFTMQEGQFVDRLPPYIRNADVDEYTTDHADTYDTVLGTLLGALLLPSLNAGSTAAQLQINISLTFDQTNPFIQDYLKTDLAQRVTGINQTTRSQLAETLRTGIEANETSAQLKSRVESVFAEAKGYRAGLIANNEVVSAYSHANHEALRATGVVTHRKWLTAGEMRVCPICSPLNGVTVPFDDDFPGGLNPGRAHISCRCTEIGLTAEGSA